MKKPTDREMEQWIKDAVQEEVKNSPPPLLTSSQAWEQLNQRLNKGEHRKKWSFFKSKTVYVASVAIVLILMFWKPDTGSAFFKLTEMFNKVQGTVVQLFINVGNRPEKDEYAPTSEDFVIIEGSEITSEKMSLDEAEKQTAFTIKIPQQIPEEFSLESVTVIKNTNQLSKEVYVNYHGNQRLFMINEKMIGDSFGASVVADQEDTKIEQVNLQGQQANLLTFKDGTLELIWVTPHYYFSISGKLSREEIINIAKSIQ